MVRIGILGTRKPGSDGYERLFTRIRGAPQPEDDEGIAATLKAMDGLGCLRRCLVRDAVRRARPVGHRPALLDHPVVHVGACDPAHGDDAPVAVAVALLTLDRTAGDALAKLRGRWVCAGLWRAT